MSNKLEEDFCINIKGVSASKVNGNEYVILRNTNSYDVNAEYRVFGLRYDGRKPDLLANGIAALGLSGSASSTKDISVGHDTTPGFNDTYYTVVVDIIHVVKSA
ncbi:hypothetical protein FACS1894181_14740 [Bacteroidia bacterium]|nr:hypothetical protein FACS1894181_14740 [Bacteroidia bacterium]